MFVCFCSSAAVQVDPRDLREQVDIIKRAAGLSSDFDLAMALDINEAQFHRQMAGDGHFSLTRIIATLAKDDPGFWPRYAWELACHYGVPAEAKRAAWLTLGALGQRRMVKVGHSQKRSA